MAQRNGDLTVKKSHQWAFILYLESAPSNWVEILRTTYNSVVVSPLHDSDVKEDGNPDKPHYHVMIVFNNSTTSTVADDIAMNLNASKPIAISNAWNYYNYFDHNHITGKAQYRHDAILFLNGLTEYDIKTLSKDQERSMRFSILRFIKENHVCEFCDLVDGLMGEDVDLADYALSHVLMFNTFITSCRNKGKKQELTGSTVA